MTPNKSLFLANAIVNLYGNSESIKNIGYTTWNFAENNFTTEEVEKNI